MTAKDEDEAKAITGEDAVIKSMEDEEGVSIKYQTCHKYVVSREKWKNLKQF